MEWDKGPYDALCTDESLLEISILVFFSTRRISAQSGDQIYRPRSSPLSGHVRINHSTSTMDKPKTPQAITVPMPLILCISIDKRLPAIWSREDCSGVVGFSFYPPNDAHRWPKTFGEIDDSRLQSLLRSSGIYAVGGVSPES